MDFNKAFTYMFEDEKWQNKLLLGLVISIVPIMNFAWFGYLLFVMRNVIRGDENPLPEWNNLGDYFMKGLLFFAGWLIYSIPLFLLLLFGGFSWLLLIPASGSDIENIVLSGLSVTSIFLLCVLVIYGLVLTIIYPAITINFGKGFQFKSIFEFSKIFEIIKINPGNYFLAWVVVLVIGFVFVFVASWLGIFFSLIPCIGTIIAYFILLGGQIWITLIDYHLFAQVGMNADEMMKLKEEAA
jgi:hypothetical protein